MSYVEFKVTHVDNGYVVEEADIPSTNIAKSREEVGKVVVGILNEVFKEPHEQMNEAIEASKAVLNPKGAVKAKTPMEAKDEG